jgi:opacity protein-like surface antigen
VEVGTRPHEEQLSAVSRKACHRVAAGLRLIPLLLLVTNVGRASSNQFTLNAGAGLGVPIGSLGDRAQLGYSVTVGAGINFRPRFSTALDYNANSIDVDLAQNLGFNSVRLWNLTANPRIRFNIGEGLQLYVTGGYGLYAREDLMNRSTQKGGINGGCGFGLRLSESVTLYFESEIPSYVYDGS